MNNKIRSLAEIPDQPNIEKLLLAIENDLQRQTRILSGIEECLTEINEIIEGKGDSPWA